ncbi:MAG: hypothetical protein B6240_12785 [Desulfobacteraceae bacterium 4572_87]|nr:MAG: hypothetical protein B6240_12785 [Desulfobacteraceae bacterium 4572_87]
MRTLAVSEGPCDGPVVELKQNDRDILALLGKGVVGKALPACPLYDTVGLMPFREGKWAYRITAGEHEGKRQEATISKTSGDHSRNPGRHFWQRSITGDCTEFYSIHGNGVINLLSEIDLTHKVITRYTPDFSIMFDGMKPGEMSQVETDINIYDLHDPTHLKYEGRLKVTHTYLGAYEITVPAGKYETILIKSFYTGKVGPAHVVDGGYTFYARDVGIVASVERMHVTAFIFYDNL